MSDIDRLKSTENSLRSRFGINKGVESAGANASLSGGEINAFNDFFEKLQNVVQGGTVRDFSATFRDNKVAASLQHAAKSIGLGTKLSNEGASTKVSIGPKGPGMK